MKRRGRLKEGKGQVEGRQGKMKEGKWELKGNGKSGREEGGKRNSYDSERERGRRGSKGEEMK